MKYYKFLFILLCFQFYISTSKSMTVTCYYASWAVYRPGIGKYDIDDLDPTICTHLIYSFVGINSNGTIRLQDPELDIGKGALYKFNAIKTRNPKLKTLVAIGGWTESPERFSKVASDPQLRKVLVEDVVKFLKTYGFDGLDFDWEYPTARGGVKEDKENFSILLKELKDEFVKHQFMLTAAVAAIPKQVKQSYDIPEISKYLDAIHVMTYDLHSAFDNVTGENSPLFSSIEERDKTRNVDSCIQYWIENGAPKHKIVLGMGSYGISYTVSKDLKSFKVGVPALGPGNPGFYTNQSGMLAYYEICNKTKRNEWTVSRDHAQKVPYAYGDGQWVGYDDTFSVKQKMKYANRHKLNGVMVWTIDTDDFRGICQTKKYPLLSVMRKYSKPKKIIQKKRKYKGKIKSCIKNACKRRFNS
nr:chitinase-3-like protein 1 [Onthophagus taurus]